MRLFECAFDSVVAFVDVYSCTSVKSFTAVYKFVHRSVSCTHERFHTVFVYVLIPGVCFSVM